MKLRIHPVRLLVSFLLLSVGITSLPLIAQIHPTRGTPESEKEATSAASAEKPGGRPDSNQSERAHIAQAYGRLPIRFEANQGQTDSQVKFLARGSGYTMFLTGDETVIQLRRSESETSAHQFGQSNPAAPARYTTSTLRMKLINAASAPIAGLDPLDGSSHYFLGNDPARWRTGVRSYQKLRQKNVWPGVDLIWHGNQQQLEYDFIIAPGANPQIIRMKFTGAQRLTIDAQGALRLETGAADLRMHKPRAWQEVNGARREVACDFAPGNHSEVGFRLGSYDRNRPLVIDPVLAYSTYLGGTGTDTAFGVAVDSDGNAYITGQTDSTDFPGQGTIQPGKGAQSDAFILKLNPAGNAIVYATWLGGNGNDAGNRIEVDAGGNAVVTGTTGSTDFPTKNPLQPNRGGLADLFLVKLNPTGSALLWSTYLGGSGNDSPGTQGLVTDSSGNVYLTGTTDSWDFPLKDAFQSVRNGSAIHTSVNGGGAWSANGAGLNVTQVLDLAIDPKNPATMYAGTERGIYRTTNSGASWSQTGASVIAFTVSQIVVDPVTTANVYAAGGAAIYKSQDSGANWTRLNVSGGVQSLAIDAVNPMTLYAVGFGFAQKSNDGGATWTPLPGIRSPFGQTAQVRTFATDPVTAATVYAGTNLGIFKSTDGGANWQQLINGLPGSVQINIDRLVISRSNPATIFALNNSGGFFKTTDGGANWSVVTPPAQVFSISTLALDPANANTVYLGVFFFGVFKSTDGGATWNAINNGLYANNVRAIAIPASSPATIHLGSDSGTEVFGAKVSASGSALVYSTYLGGSGVDNGYGIAVDADGNAYLTGDTRSLNFPLRNAFQSTLNGPRDAFVTKLNPAGSGLVWSTFLGGSSHDYGSGIAVNSAGNVFVGGSSSSTDFPVVKAIQTVNRSTSAGGYDAFITRFSSDGSKLDFSTWLGGNDFETSGPLTTDSVGNVYFIGSTASTDFPTASAVQSSNGNGSQFPGYDVFAVRLSADGSTLAYSTYLGGSGFELGYDIAVDATGNVYVVGRTDSINFPTTPNPLRATPSRTEGFISKLALNADLAISVNDLPDPVMVNNNLTYTVTVTSNGPDMATGVNVTDTLPAGVTFVSSAASQGSCSGSGPVNCNLGELASGGKATITIVVTPNSVATLSSQASVTSAMPDLNSANNSASQETKVSTQPSIYGRVTTGNGAGLGNVTMSLADAQKPAVTTASDGGYQFAELTTGAGYTVTPARQGYVFNPPNRSHTNLSADQRADFSAVACLFSIAPLVQSFQVTGGTGTVTITSPDPQCPWTARSNVPWLTITSAASGNGAGTISFSVAPTVGSRSGTMTIAGNTLTVWQEFNPCSVLNFPALPVVPITPSGASAGLPNFVVKDFNGDGQSDIAWVGATGNSNQGVTVLLSNSGGYAAPVDVLTVSDPPAFLGLRSADFNNDGKPDLVTIRGTRIHLLLNNGAGGFNNPVETTLAQSIGSLTTGDFNGDRNTDIALHTLDVPPDNKILILPGTGAGGLGAAGNISHNPLAPTGQLESGDFNGDGKADLAMLYGPGLIDIMKGTGGGDFTFSTTLDVTGGPPGIFTLGDLNGDLKSDVVYLQSFESQYVSVFLADNVGGFNPPLKAGIAGPGKAVIAEDFNGDGKAEIAMLTTSGVTLLSATGGSLAIKGFFFTGTTAAVRAGSNTVAFFGAGDYNRDGRTDLFVPVSAGLAALVSDGNGGFNGPRSFPLSGTSPNLFQLPVNPSAMKSADLNGDGVLDLATILADKVVVLFGNGRGEFGAPVEYPAGNSPQALAISDLNRDGKPDLAVLNNGSNNVTILINDGTGAFPLNSGIAVGTNPRSFAIEDFTGDGIPDLLVKAAAGGLALLAGDGKGAFTTFTPGLAPDFNDLVFRTGDFNGDGNTDVIALNAVPFLECSVTGRQLVILVGDGKGGFATALRRTFAELTFEAVPGSIEVADLNGDSRADLLLTFNCQSGQTGVYVMLADSAGGFGAPVRYNVGNPPTIATINDFNGDGRADVLVMDTSSSPGSVSILTGRGDGGFNPAVQLPYSFFPGIIASADFNEDGAPDLAVGSIGMNSIAILPNLSLCAPANSLTAASAASYARYKLAGESITATFGAGLAASVQAATTVPLPTTLGGVSVRVRDSAGTERAAPLFFVSPNQINYQVPPGAASGTAMVTVMNGASVVSTGSIQINAVSPGLFAADSSGGGYAAALALRVRPDNSFTYEPVTQFNQAQNKFIAVPIDLNDTADQVFLVLFGTGIRNRSALSAVKATIGGVEAEVTYAGSQNGFVGLDQVNVRIPRALVGRGETEISLTVDGRAANTVRVNIK